MAFVALYGTVALVLGFAALFLVCYIVHVCRRIRVRTRARTRAHARVLSCVLTRAHVQTITALNNAIDQRVDSTTTDECANAHVAVHIQTVNAETETVGETGQQLYTRLYYWCVAYNAYVQYCFEQLRTLNNTLTWNNALLTRTNTDLTNNVRDFQAIADAQRQEIARLNAQLMMANTPCDPASATATIQAQ